MQSSVDYKYILKLDGLLGLAQNFTRFLEYKRLCLELVG